MSNPRMASIHLDGKSRRDQFRHAREVLQQACGEQTKAGDARLLEADEEDAPTVVIAPLALPATAGTRLACYLKDGDHVYPLRLGMNSVGRLSDNDVVIKDECVSRRHCAVVVHSDYRCEIHDVASKNGTLLNGHKINGPTRLQSGDQLTLCNKLLTFTVTDRVS